MSLVDRLFRRRDTRPEVALPALTEALSAAVAEMYQHPVETLLVRARLADAYRDMDLEPPAPAELDLVLAPLDSTDDAEAWPRMAILVAAVAAVAAAPSSTQPTSQSDHRSALRRALPQVLPAGGVAEQIRVGLVTPSLEYSLLTMELLRQSPLRVEELARHVLAALALGIVGESAEASAERRRALDYGRLLQEAEQARQDAEARAEALRKLRSEEHEQVRRRRGKW